MAAHRFDQPHGGIEIDRENAGRIGLHRRETGGVDEGANPAPT